MSNDLSKVAELTKNQPFGLKTVDSDGKVTPILPDKDDMLIDVSNFETKPQTDPEPDDGTNTSGGVNIVPGSIYDGSITERYLLWQGETDPSKVNTITFLSDVGAKLNRVGDGLQFRVHLLKTPVTVGVKSSPVDLDLNYDSQNNPKENVFTTTSPIPFSIPVSKLSSGNKVVIDIDGIGENFESVKNHLAPTISLIFNADKTLSIETTEGYDLNGAVEGNTGAFYKVVVDLVNSYSTQNPVAQLPSGIMLMSGDASGEVPMQFVNNDYSNISGLKITFGSRLYNLESSAPDITKVGTQYLKLSELGIDIDPILKIPKDDLLIGKKIASVSTFNKKAVVYKIASGTEMSTSDLLEGRPEHITVVVYNSHWNDDNELRILNGKVYINISLVVTADFDDPIRVDTVQKYYLSIADISTY